MRKCYIYGVYRKDDPNNIIYIGQHNYIKLNDSYMGSGKKLLELYKLNKKENFGKIIFETIEYDEENKNIVGEKEKEYIKKYKEVGQAELNISNGSNPTIKIVLDGITLEERALEIRKQNREVKKTYDKLYYLSNKEKKKNSSKEYYDKNKEAIKQKNKEYRDKNKEKIKDKQKEYREKNKEIIKQRKKDYRDKNREEINKKKREDYLRKREEILKRQKIVSLLKKNNKEIFEQYSKIKTTVEKKKFIDNLKE